MTFGEKIQKLRKEAGLSQEELSYQLGVSRQAVSKWERDNGYPETEKIVRIRKCARMKTASMSAGKWRMVFWLTKKEKC